MHSPPCHKALIFCIFYRIASVSTENALLSPFSFPFLIMRIAVLADTHNQLPPSLLEHLARADFIWHLGDVCLPATLEPIEALGVPMLVVRGNNDVNPRLAAHRP